MESNLTLLSRFRLGSLLAVMAAAPAAGFHPINAGNPEVTFSSAASSAIEGPTTINVQVTLSAAASAPVSIPFTVGGSATTADATVAAGPLVIPTGGTSGTIDVGILQDSLSEGRERVTLTLGTPTNGTLGATTVHQVVILDDEPAASISFDLASSSASEGAGSETMTLTLSAPRTEEARVSFAQTGTATPGGVDVSTSPASPLVIPAGATTASIDAILVQDPFDEADETFMLTLLAPVNCALGGTVQHTLTIVDDDAAPAVNFDVAASNVLESSAGSTISVSLSAQSSFDVTIPITAAGTATPGSDYTWTPGGASSAGSLVISAGAVSGNLTLTPTDDATPEGSETIQFVLGTPTNGTVGSSSSHQVVMIDNDGSAVDVSFDAVASTVLESVGTTAVGVTLSDYAAQTVTVPVSTSGSATIGSDYTLSTPTISIPVGSLTGSAEVTVIDDSSSESDETIALTLGSPTGASLGSPGTHTLTVTDNDGVITVDFATPVSAASEGAGLAVVGVTLSGSAPSEVTVPVAVTGTATGADYSVTPNPLVIPTGGTLGQFSINLVGDALYENDETVVLTFGTPVGADLGSQTDHTFTITNDDAVPTVQFTSFRTVVDEIDGGFNVRVQLDAASGLPVTVPFTVGGTASGPSDSTLPPSPAVIPEGATFVDLPVTLVVDRVPELGEKIAFALGAAATNANVGSIATHVVLLQDGSRSPFVVPTSLSPSVSSLTFPTRRVSEASPSQSVFFTNLNSTPLTLTDVSRTGSMKGDFNLAFASALPITVAPGASAEVQVTFEPLGQGPRSLTLRAVTQETTRPATPVDLGGIAYGPTGAEILMNAAAEMFDGPARDDYSADYGATGGAYASSFGAVAGTSLDGLYHTFRLGSNFSYAFTLPNGAYDVVVRAWEPNQTQPGARVFDVLAEGNVVIDDLDMVAEVGPATAYTSAPLRAVVTDGVLDLAFASVQGQALVSAIEVRSVAEIDIITPSLSFGDVDQGASSTLMVDFENTGLHAGFIDRLTFRVGDQGDARDFSVEAGGTVYTGSTSTVIRSPFIELPPGITSVPVTFTPTFHEDHLVTLEFENASSGELFALDATGTGGAQAGWGFLHPVPDQSPVFVVDYDEDGMETVALLGGESHTHEPGHELVTFDWTVDGQPSSANVDSVEVLPVGTTTVSLTIGDDNIPAATATDSRTITVHPLDRVPGILALFYDGSIVGEQFLLDNLPPRYNFASRLTGLQINAENGKVGASPFTEKVMVRWVAQFDTVSSRTLEFVATGGIDRRVIINSAPASGPTLLPAGTHDVEVRFAVTSLADLPVQLSVTENGSVAHDIEASFVHDLGPIPPAIHNMPTSGTDLGGNRIDIDGFGFFPEAGTIVHWGLDDFTAADFDAWDGERITLTTPPGNGSIMVTVETPQGTTDPVQFDYSPTGPIPVRFTVLDSQAVSISDVTCAQWGPDGKLYVAVVDGSLRILTYDDNWSITSIQFKLGVSGLTNRDTLGMAFNPFDAYDPQDPSSIKLYVSHGEQYHNGGGAFTGPSYYTGQVSVLQGPNFDNPQPLITQLPVSNHDHSVNGPFFDDNGDLLLCVGGNTNGGVKAAALGDVPESPFSAAILRAFTSRPNFNGTILYQDTATGVFVDDQVFGETVDVAPGVDIEVYAPGFRNSLDMVLHTNGYMYATDNGANAGFGPASLTLTTDLGPGSANAQDEVNLVEQGVYYGSANRNRGRYYDRETVYRSPSVASVGGEFRKPLRIVASSTNGIDEYRATAFNSAMRGELIAAKWNSGLYRLELGSDGRRINAATLYDDNANTAFPPNKGLDVIAAPGGALIVIDYSGNKIRVQVPDDVSAIGATPYDIFPWRVPATGGQNFVIGGLNLGTNLNAVSVTIGGVPAVLTSVSETRIRGVYPPSATGAATELLDVVVTIGSSVKTLTEAVRYMPPTPGQAQGTWRPGSGLPLPLGEVASAVIGSKMYLFGQGDGRTFVHDFVQGSWSLGLAQRQYTGNHHGCEVIGDLIYLMGGLDNGSAGKVQIYDTVANSWSLGAPMPWNGGSCATALINGKIYVGGGNLQGSGTAGNFAVYDPALDTWTALGMMPTPVNHAAAGTDGEKLYVFGGRQGMNIPQPGFDDVQIYDPVTDTWATSDASQVAAMPQGRGGTGRAVFLRGEFMIMGGESDTEVFDDVQIYNPVTDTWRTEKPMTTARHGIYPVEYEGRIHVLGGGLVAGFGFSALSEVLSPH
jgi:hypothetical protein